MQSYKSESKTEGDKVQADDLYVNHIREGKGIWDKPTIKQKERRK